MDKTTSKGTIQGYNGIAINDDKHPIILQAQAWGTLPFNQKVSIELLLMKFGSEYFNIRQIPTLLDRCLQKLQNAMY